MKLHLVNILASLLLCCLISKESNAQEQLQLNTETGGGFNPVYSAMAVDQANGTPYVAFNGDVTMAGSKATNKLHVSMWTGKEWILIGNPNFSEGSAESISIVIDPKGVPYVAFTDKGSDSTATTDDRVKVARLLGSTWEIIFTSNADGKYSSLAFNTNGELYLAYQDYGNAGKAVVKSFTNTRTAWTSVGDESGVSTDAATHTAIVFDSHNNLYLAYSEGNKAVVKKRTSSAWEQVGASSLDGIYASNTTIAIGQDNIPYLLFRTIAANTGKAAKVYKLNGDDWVSIGAATGFGKLNQFNATTPDDFVHLAIGKDNVPIVGIMESTGSANENRVNIYRFSAETAVWDALGGGPSDPSAKAISQGFALYKENNTVYMSARDAVGDTQATKSLYVLRLDASNVKKVFFIGDSTVQDYTAGWYPLKGWGQMLPHFFNNSELTFINKAVGGTSSKSFYDNYWTAVLSEVQEGDYVFIQFGHNDYNPTDPNRHTSEAAYKQYIQNYVLQTRNKFAYPVLVTPVHRNNWNSNGDQISNAWRNYPNLMREVASQLNVPLIDLHNRSEALFESLGRDYVSRHVFLYLKAGEYVRTPLDASNLSDGVHFQEMGAIDLAKLIIDGIKALPARTEMAYLASQLRPTYEVTVTSNTAGTNHTRPASFPEGIPVTLKVSKPAGQSFAGWTDSNGNMASIVMNYSFIMPANPISYRANFTPEVREPLVAGATYRIEARHSKLYLDVNNLWRIASPTMINGTEIVQYPYTGTLSQQWVLEDVGEGYYTLTSVNSNKSMQMQNNSTSDGASVVQFTTGTAATTSQHFQIVPTDDGHFQIIARNSNKCLQFTNASTTLGEILKQQTCGTATSQQFSFHRLILAPAPTSSPNEKGLGTELQVYPNPSNTAFRISTASKFSYFVYDELGKVQESGEGNQQREIGVGLKPGMYFMKVQAGQNHRVIKLIKQ